MATSDPFAELYETLGTSSLIPLLMDYMIYIHKAYSPELAIKEGHIAMKANSYIDELLNMTLENYDQKKLHEAGAFFTETARTYFELAMTFVESDEATKPSKIGMECLNVFQSIYPLIHWRFAIVRSAMNSLMDKAAIHGSSGLFMRLSRYMQSIPDQAWPTKEHKLEVESIIWSCAARTNYPLGLSTDARIQFFQSQLPVYDVAFERLLKIAEEVDTHVKSTLHGRPMPVIECKDDAKPDGSNVEDRTNTLDCCMDEGLAKLNLQDFDPMEEHEIDVYLTPTSREALSSLVVGRTKE